MGRQPSGFEEKYSGTILAGDDLFPHLKFIDNLGPKLHLAGAANFARNGSQGKAFFFLGDPAFLWRAGGPAHDPQLRLALARRLGGGAVGGRGHAVLPGD